METWNHNVQNHPLSNIRNLGNYNDVTWIWGNHLILRYEQDISIWTKYYLIGRAMQKYLVL
jgi:hypothetical protein